MSRIERVIGLEQDTPELAPAPLKTKNHELKL
jgi:hypothetical protein